MPFGNQLSRRELGKMALGGALGATTLGWSRSSSAQERYSSATVPPQPPGIQVGCEAPLHPTDEDLLFYKQAGVDCVDVTDTPEDQSVKGLLSIKKRYVDAGFMVANIDNMGTNNNLMPIVLNRPGRDELIEAFKTWLRTLGNAGVYSIKALQYNVTGVVSSSHVQDRGSRAREFDLNSPELSGSPVRMSSKGSANALLFGREYSRDEIWANYTYFIKQIAPVAEEAGVAIGLHPDDPTVPSLFGVPRILSNFEDCKKALEIANSPNVKICMACGPWLEGGAAMGIDPAGAIRHFASRKQLSQVYFRNASSPVPHFHETFVDEGYYDMYKIVKTLVDVKYDGVITLDHSMPMVGGPHTYEAFGLGYLRAMLQCAQRGYHA